MRPRLAYAGGTSDPGDVGRLSSFVRERLAEVGVSVRPSGRLAQSLEIVAQFTELIEDGRHVMHVEPNAAWAFTCGEIYRACLTLEVFRGQKEIVQRIVNALDEGAVLPPPPGKFDHGRDIFAEYLVAARFARSGLPVRFEEPDFSFHYHGHWFGVAVKRINSTNPRALESQFSAGRDQISRSKRPGIVAFELSNLAQEMVAPVGPVTLDAMTSVRLRLQDDVHEGFLSKMAKTRKNVKETIGLVSMNTITAYVADEATLRTMATVNTSYLWPDGSRRANQVYELGNLLMVNSWPQIT